MKNLASRIIGLVRSEPVNVDSRIPDLYLVSYFFSRSIMLLRGIIKLRRLRTIVLIGRSTVIKCKSKIRINGPVVIDMHCVVNALSVNGITLGRNVTIGKFSTIECSGSLSDIGSGLTVGNNVGLGSHGFFGCAGGVKIGDETIFGNYVSVHSENHNFGSSVLPIRMQGISRKGINIGKNCWIGAKVTILDGANIADGCVIAAGAVVIAGDYPPNAIIGGIPGKILKYRF